MNKRWTASVIFLIITSIGVVASAAARWTHDILLDTDAWMETVGPVGTSPIVRNALADRASEEIVVWMDVEDRITGFLPPALEPLAPLIGARVNETIVEETHAFFDSQFYEDAWLRVNRTVHTAAVALIRDQVQFVSTEGGVVEVDLVPILTPIIDRVIARFQDLGQNIPPALLDRVEIDDVIREMAQTYQAEGLPESLSHVVVYESTALASLQRTAAFLDLLSWLLPVITIVAAGLAVYLAPDRNRMIALLLGSVALAWAVARLALNTVLNLIVAGIESNTAATVAREVFTQLTGGLGRILVWLGVIAAVASGLVVLWNWLAERRNTPSETPTEA